MLDPVARRVHCVGVGEERVLHDVTLQREAVHRPWVCHTEAGHFNSAQGPAIPVFYIQF